MSELKLTPEQKEAIFYTGSNVLVAASAGSGKTFVLSHRIIEKIRTGINLDSLFVSTFTKKAANELKLRLEKDLKKAARETKNQLERQRFSTAIQYIGFADIGTMDAFAQKFVREYFNLAGIDPNFRILADESERNLLMKETFDEQVEICLRGEAEKISKTDFETCLRNFSNNQTLKVFQDVVYKIYQFCQATENPEEWFKNQFLSGFKELKSFTQLDGSFTDIVKQDLQELGILFDYALDNKVVSGAVSVKKVESFLENLDLLLALLDKKELAAFTDLFLSLNLEISVGKTKDEALQAEREEFKLTKQEVLGTKTNPGRIREFINLVKHSKLIEKHQPEAEKVVKTLQNFSFLFFQAYTEKKKLAKAYEYADIAHFAIQILEKNQDLRLHYQAKYDEIMIDEYQDTSHTQEALLLLLSSGKNLFMVGDIKQSIYGFRLADPSLFLEKYKTYTEAKNPNKLIRLKENFRSRGEILHFTNEVFKHLMDEKIGEMTYGQAEELVQGNTTDYPDRLDPAFNPELLLYQENTASSTEGEMPLLSKGELNLVAQKIQELAKSGVAYKDIAFLVRSKTANNEIEDTLTSYGIPVVLDEGRVDFLKSIEILVMLDLMRALDNPLYDIPLVAALRSPIFGFDENELTEISLEAGSDLHFWEKIQLYLSHKTSAKLTDFVKQFTDWRNLIQQISIHELLWKIYTESYYYDYVGALPNGEMRQANLQALSSRAEAYETSGYKGLSRFIALIDGFMEQNNDLASVSLKLPQNAVRVLTFHKAKGLEFNYVFLMNLQSKFNQRDLNEPLNLTRRYGIGIKYIFDFKNEVDTDFPYALARMETIPYLVNREEKLLSSLAEEMRVLYVAFTRAKLKLYLVGKINEKEDYEKVSLEGQILNNKYRKSAKGFQHWLLALDAAKKLPMQVRIFTDDELVTQEDKTSQKMAYHQLLKEVQKFDGQMEELEDLKKARQIMNFNYPYVKATRLASIQTPSQVKKRYEKLIESDGIQTVDRPRLQAFKFFEEADYQHFSPTEIGSVIHSFMQQVDFTDVKSWEVTLDRLNIDPGLKKQVDVAKLSTLLDSNFGKILAQNQDSLIREAPFSMLKLDEESGEQYVVRGIVDGFVKLGDRIFLFDYKTDKFSDAVEIKNRYRLQMELYGEALSKAYPGVTIEKYLILLGGKSKVLVEKL